MALFELRANRQRIVYFFPTAHRLVSGVGNRQRIVQIRVGCDSVLGDI
jgi:hypothetical protein